MLCVVAVLMLLVFMLVKFRRGDTDNDKYILEVDPEDDIRENVINYDEEGAGKPLDCPGNISQTSSYTSVIA